MRTTPSRLVPLVAAAAFTLSLASAVTASADTVRVDADGVGGWAFNADPAFTTPYAFSTAEESIGAGSLFVPPITNTNGTPGSRDKFIGINAPGTLVSDLTSLAYDFQVASAGPTHFKQFYLNVYTNLPASTTFFDCRWDYVPTSGAAGSWTTMSVTPATVPTGKGDRVDAFVCPLTMDQMPAGSTVRAFALNVGDTGFGDTGVSGYYDNVVVSTSGGSTTYDFEATPSNKDDCKKGGHVDYGFENQGQCVARVNALS